MPAPPSTPVVWITGAAGTLGAALVNAFLSAGCRVAATCRGTHSFHGTDVLWPLRMDVTSAGEVRSIARELRLRWGRIDVLINNAGITRDSLVPQMTEESWDAVMKVNLTGAFLCSREAAAAMIRQRSGHIVNISSFAAKRGHAGQANYVAAKAALIGVTQSLAQELGSRGVCVNAVMPGVLPGAMTTALSDTQRAALIEANALKRINDPEEVARFVQFLTTLKNVSGQVFQLDSRIGSWT